MARFSALALLMGYCEASVVAGGEHEFGGVVAAPPFSIGI